MQDEISVRPALPGAPKVPVGGSEASAEVPGLFRASVTGPEAKVLVWAAACGLVSIAVGLAVRLATK